jgi:UDP-N-acetylmuramoylalanine--D-glutamate ligase
MKGKKVLVIGLGKSGRSAVKFLLKKEAIVAGVDRDHQVLSRLADEFGPQVVFRHDSSDLDMASFDLVVVSPGVPKEHRLYQKAQSCGIEVIGEVELACRALKPRKFLAVTGTNGKTTVTLLVAHVLNQARIPARALGNVGEPLTDHFLMDEGEIAVVELSSYQLETMKTAVIDAAVILNITPDHLDRYRSMEEYAAAKIGIRNCMKEGGALYANKSVIDEYGQLFNGSQCKTIGYDSDCSLRVKSGEVILNEKVAYILPSVYRGKRNHDLENQLAAFALCCEVGVTSEQFLLGLSSFHKPAHRIEFVRLLNGVSYYDDSKGTNIDAVLKAVQMVLEGLEGKVVLIAGGVDKGAPYTPWIKSLLGKIKHICAIGQAAGRIKEDLDHFFPVTLFHNLEECVAFAKSIAKPGDCVLLSPGCSSLDMFRDYAHRGEEFQKLVRKL